jgi:hypothetical protein
MPYTKSATKEDPGRMAIQLQDGTLLVADEISPYPYGFVVKGREGWEFTVRGDEITQLLPIDEQGQVIGAKVEESKLVFAIVTLEQLWLERQAQLPRPRSKSELILFGSTSLSLTVAPARVSHDIDAVVDREDTAALQDAWAKRRAGQPTLLELDSCDDSLLRYLGDWRGRAITFKKTENYEILVPHPLDTLSQKLLRSNEPNFQKKDLPDIKAIMDALNPNGCNWK